MTVNTAVVEMAITPAEARALTDRIKATADQLWTLLLEAHERQAWSALGYPSFTAYAKVEFDMGSSHAYRLLDQGRVIRALEAAAHSPAGEISERVARDIKPKLALVTAEISDRIQQGEPPDTAIQAVINQARKATYSGSRKHANRSNRIAETTAFLLWNEWVTCDFVSTTGIDFEELDLSLIPEWAQQLRQAARKINLFARRLEREAGRRDDRESGR